MDYVVHGFLQARVLEVGSCSLLQGIFPTQGLNPGLPHCRGINYQLSHQGSLRILECVVYPFSSGSSRPRNQTGVSCIAGGIFTSWATRKALCARVCLWTVTPQALSMEFSRQEYWSGLPFLTEGSNLCLLQFLYWQADRQWCIYVNSDFPIHSTPVPHLGVHMFVLYVCVFIPALQIGSSVPFF